MCKPTAHEGDFPSIFTADWCQKPIPSFDQSVARHVGLVLSNIRTSSTISEHLQILKILQIGFVAGVSMQIQCQVLAVGEEVAHVEP